MELTLDRSVIQNFHEAIGREWLETNGLGGWASSTITGANTRRYHGLLVAATDPPLGRMVLLSKLDETLICGGNRFDLGCNIYPGAVHPKGYSYLSSFTRGLFPVFKYEAGDISLRKTIAAVNGENSTIILYEVLKAPSPCILELRPFIAARGFHDLTHANDSINKDILFDKGQFSVKPYRGVPHVCIFVPGSSFEVEGGWYYNFKYPVEGQRGLDFYEDLFTYGTFNVKLQEGDRLGVIVSTSSHMGKDAFQLFEGEKERRERLPLSLPVNDGVSRILSLAADQFIVMRGVGLRTTIAGYHWFADWGRDTMIAFSGLCLVTGRFDDGKKILKAFARNVDKGMLPNRFPDSGEKPEYNSVDAALWFFVAIYHYLRYTGDELFVGDELYPLLREIIHWHDRGTRYNIHVDESGLLVAGEPGVQLTWMDSKVGDRVITPRQGKAVEINALWYNALSIFAGLSQRFGSREEEKVFRARARHVKEQFLEEFWYGDGGYLYDYTDGAYRDRAIRPNQIFALSLPSPLLGPEKARGVLDIVRKKLYTPYGLRSLAPHEKEYRGSYGGDQNSRDSAYHQGTAWGWLLGPYITSTVRFEGKKGKEEALKIVKMVLPHLKDGGVGTVSEIFDGDGPHRPRGCIAQAWSVAELLRAYIEDVMGSGPIERPLSL